MGKLTISMAIFNSKLLVYQRVLFFSATWKLLPPSHVRQRMIHYEFVNGKDDIPDMMESHKIHVPNHQPAKYDCQKSSEHLLELPSNSEVFQVLLGNDIVLTALGVTGWEFPRVQLAMVRTCEKVERSRKKHNMLVVVMHCILPRKNVDDRWCNKNWDVPTWCGWCVHMCMCLCTCVCICIHVYVYVYVYIYVIHIYIIIDVLYIYQTTLPFAVVSWLHVHWVRISCSASSEDATVPSQLGCQPCRFNHHHPFWWPSQ